MSHPSRAPDRARAFTSFYEAAYPDLVRFLQRRTGADHAEDLAAEAFLVVWRRLDELPRLRDDARAWLFGIARNILLNEHRGERRRQALAVRLADVTSLTVDSHTDFVVSRVDLATAWNLLSEVHQEVLSLAVLEDLKAPQAAAVLGISPVAFRLRLSRARRALRAHLHHLPHPAQAPADLSGRTITP